MNIFIILHFFIISIIGGGIAALADSRACVYKEERGTMTCRGAGDLRRIPLAEFENKIFDTLDLAYNNITTFVDLKPLLSIHARGQIKTLLLDHNQISRFPHRLLTIFPNIETLDLSYNKLTHLPSWFCHLTALKELMLQGNCIQTIGSMALRCANYFVVHFGNCDSTAIFNAYKTKMQDNKFERPMNEEHYVTTKPSFRNYEIHVTEQLKNSAASALKILYIIVMIVWCVCLISEFNKT